MQKGLPQQAKHLTIISHELKSKLFGIKEYAQLLEKRLIPLQDPKLLSYIQKIDTRLDTFSYTLSDLLDYLRIQEASLSINPEFFKLDEVLTDVVKVVKEIFPDAKIILEGNCTKEVFADRNKIERVCFSLLHNASMYTKEVPDITMLLQETDKEISIAIVDKGIGIPQEHLQHLFQAFFTVPLKEYKDRIGLSLFVAKNVLELHKGWIRAESTEGEGATFTFGLPV